MGILVKNFVSLECIGIKIRKNASLAHNMRQYMMEILVEHVKLGHSTLKIEMAVFLVVKQCFMIN